VHQKQTQKPEKETLLALIEGSKVLTPNQKKGLVVHFDKLDDQALKTLEETLLYGKNTSGEIEGKHQKTVEGLKHDYQSTLEAAKRKGPQHAESKERKGEETEIDNLLTGL